MNRLTRRDCDGNPFLAPCDYKELLERLAAYEDTGLEPDVCANYRKFEDEAISKNVTFNRIVELMNAEAEGRLIVLPYKVGNSVWSVVPFKDGKIREGHITQINIGDGGRIRGFWASFSPEPVSAEFIENEIGKTVFLTREEAEKALKEVQR